MPDAKSEVRHAAEEPVTIDILCRCMIGLLLGGLLGIGLAPSSASSYPPMETLHIIFGILVSVLAGAVSRGHAAALLSTGTGTLLVVSLQSLTVPLNSPLPWMGGAAFMAPGLMLLFSQSELRGSSSIDEGPDKFQHVKSVITGIIAGLLLQIPLACQVIITPSGSHDKPLPFGPYFLVYLLIVAATMAGTAMIVNRTLAAPIIMITVCLIGAWSFPFPHKILDTAVNSDTLMILRFGVIVLSVTVPLRLKDAR